MAWKQKDRRIKLQPSTLEERIMEKRLEQLSVITKPDQKPRKPRGVDRDKETYFRAEFYCPHCNAFLTSYTYGREWTDNGLHDDKRVDCRICGQMIDWVDVPGED